MVPLMIDRFVLIIGAMKCGTTSLYAYLGQHPQVCPSLEKESNFFIAERSWPRGLDWYHALWNWVPGTHTVALEASTGYTKRPMFEGVADRIASVDADFRFVYLMRDPIARVESHHRHDLLKAGRGAGAAPPKSTSCWRIGRRSAASVCSSLKIFCSRGSGNSRSNFLT